MPVRLPPEQNAGVHGDRQTEVDQLQVPFLVDHDVTRAEVAMEPFVVVQILDGVAELAQVVDAIARELRVLRVSTR